MYYHRDLRGFQSDFKGDMSFNAIQNNLSSIHHLNNNN